MPLWTDVTEWRCNSLKDKRLVMNLMKTKGKIDMYISKSTTQFQWVVTQDLYNDNVLFIICLFQLVNVIRLFEIVLNFLEIMVKLLPVH